MLGAGNSSNGLTVWLLVGAALCLVVGLVGTLGPSLVWFLTALVLDAVAVVLYLRRRT